MTTTNETGIECPRCAGTGELSSAWAATSRCGRCEGTGRVDFRKLMDWSPVEQAADLGDKAERLRFARIVTEFVTFREESGRRFRPWPGRERNVNVWVEVEHDGKRYGVGFNENPSLGWSFPVRRLHEPHAVASDGAGEGNGRTFFVYEDREVQRAPRSRKSTVLSVFIVFEDDGTDEGGPIIARFPGAEGRDLAIGFVEKVLGGTAKTD